jgi:hypothetical protein
MAHVGVHAIPSCVLTLNNESMSRNSENKCDACINRSIALGSLVLIYSTEHLSNKRRICQITYA